MLPKMKPPLKNIILVTLVVLTLLVTGNYSILEYKNIDFPKSCLYK